MSFYRTFVLYNNSLNEFTVESRVCPSLTDAHRCGQNVLIDENVYGYVVVKMNQDSWEIVSEIVHGCDYTVYEKNGVVYICEGVQSLTRV